MKNKQDNESLRLEVERLKSENEDLRKTISGPAETNAENFFSKMERSEEEFQTLVRKEAFVSSLIFAISDSVIVANKSF